MPAAARLGDLSNVSGDAHGCPACPHVATGPAIMGSPTVLINGRPAVRVGDIGIHAVCCGPNMWTAHSGSSTVFIDGSPAHRQGDDDLHCGTTMGTMQMGSPDVLIGG